MKKRTYKQIQNRLYREIKRRMLLEHSLAFPPKVCIEQRKVDTIKVKNRFPNYMAEHIEIIKTDMARMLVNKLISEGYVEFYSNGQDYGLPVEDYSEIVARLYVVRQTY